MREIVSISGSDHCGFHINPNDPMDIAWGITSAIEDPEKRKEFGVNGRKRVLEFFNWDAAARATIDRYAELVEENES